MEPSAPFGTGSWKFQSFFDAQIEYEHEMGSILSQLSKELDEPGPIGTSTSEPVIITLPKIFIESDDCKTQEPLETGLLESQRFSTMALPPSKRLPCFEMVPLFSLPQTVLDPGYCKTHALFRLIDHFQPGAKNSMMAVKHLISKVPTIIIGMDVSHDGSPRHPDGPSIAAVVHSREWPLISEYRAYVQTQSPKVGTVHSLYQPVREGDGKMRDAGIMRELLLDFYIGSGERMPEQIIIFRYGVGESQLTEALNAEVDQMIEACKFIDERWSPKFVVINFCEPGALSPTRTAIDVFSYLCAQARSFETTGPSHFYAVLDQVGLSAKDLRKLVHSLSYVYQLRTAAISTLAPDCFGYFPVHNFPVHWL